MHKLVQSWIFFTAVLFLFLAAAISFPALKTRWMGETEEQLEVTVEEMEGELWSVWAEKSPWSRP